MATKPTDRFDSVPDDLLRTGAHRAAPRRGRGWIAFAWAALATGVLFAAGLFGLAVIRGTIELPFAAPSASASPRPSVIPTPTTLPAKIDPALAITVLNGTPTKGLASAVGDNLVKQGWTGASSTIGSRTNAGSTDVATTVVYYTDAANEPAARAMLLSLKVGAIRLSTAYPGSPITVVLGRDYVLPAG
ncbi:MAG: LytR C-terminal domain-containing protein [Actinomycetota bacterium]